MPEPDRRNLIELAYASIDRMPEYPTVAESAERLGEMLNDHIEILDALTARRVEDARAIDLVIIAALLRSQATVVGFLDMVERRNKLAALPMIRFQLDSSMRLFACALATELVDFVKHVLDGGLPSKYQTHDGRRMTDHLLHTELSALYPGMTEAYEETSGFVHLSKSHLAQVFDHRKSTLGSFVFSDPTSLVHWDELQVKAAMVRFCWATSCLLHLCYTFHDPDHTPPPPGFQNRSVS